MNLVTLIGALYVIIPAVLALAAVLYATYCPIVISEQESVPMLHAVLTQIATMVDRKASAASDAADYWRGQVQRARTPHDRAKARAYATMWEKQWREMSERACKYRAQM